MVRILQKMIDRRDGSTIERLGWMVVVASLGAAIHGCGPIEADQPEQGPPYIAEVSPAEANYQIPRGNNVVTFEALRLYDPNREEDGLYVAWYSSDDGFISRTTTGHVTETQLQGGTFHQYEAVSEDIDMCPDGPDGSQGPETIWMYVSDRPFADIAGDSVVPSEEGYLVSRAWVLNFTCV